MNGLTVSAEYLKDKVEKKITGFSYKKKFLMKPVPAGGPPNSIWKD